MSGVWLGQVIACVSGALALGFAFHAVCGWLDGVTTRRRIARWEAANLEETRRYNEAAERAGSRVRPFGTG